MTFVRSILFNAFFFVLHLVLVLGMVFLLPLPRHWMQGTVRFWTQVLRVGAGIIVGLRIEFRGLENRPRGAAVLACKHQSALDTFAFYLVLGDPNYILKAELMRVPLWGWHARKCGAIAVDRRGGAGALKKMVADTRDRLRRGRQVIIFPEGTRTKPGERRPYNPGVAAIDAAIEQAVIPVAVNSGLFWGKRSFIKRPGMIVFEFLDPMPKGLKRREFMAELETRIETASVRLTAEARERFPHLPQGR